MDDTPRLFVTAAVLVLAWGAFATPVAAQGFVEFVDETDARLTAPSALGVSDVDEKDYA
jgi:hypothetical protein